MQESAFDYSVGCRIEDAKGFRGSVKYVGPVGSTVGEWLGVEWDDSGRGKHSGSHEGVSYFLTESPNAGSFVRPSSKLCPGIGIKDAVEERYGAKGASEEFRPEDMREIQRELKASLFEVVGMDKIREAQKNYWRLNVISLRNLRVQTLGDHLKDFIPNVRSLDLGENLISSWDEVLHSIKDLPYLEHLCLSENRLSLPQNPPSSLPQVKHLVLGRMNLNWSDVLRIIPLFPSLKNLQLHGNRISSMDESPADLLASLCPHLKELDMNLNPLVHWSHVSKFSQCPSLEAMKLNDCQLREVGQISEGDFPLLRKIELNCNDFVDWRSLGHLEDLPSLRDIRLRGQEISQCSPLKPPKNRRLSSRQAVIAMFSRITILNGTEIDRQERYGAEVDYIKMFGLDYFALKKGEEHAVAIPRYEALVEIHGPPDESELSGRDSNMDDMFLHLSLEYAQDSRSKKVTKTMTVKALKILAKKLFKAPNIKDMELFYTSQKSPDMSIPLDDDMRDITYFGILSGDTIKINCC